MTDTPENGNNRPGPGSLPVRSARARSDLTGPEISRALKSMGVSPGQFCRISGTSLSRFKRELKHDPANLPPGERDPGDDLPLYYEVVLFALYHFPALRTHKGPLPLPFDEWGIDIDLVDC